MVAKRKTENMDAGRPDAEELKKLAAEKKKPKDAPTEPEKPPEKPKTLSDKEIKAKADREKPDVLRGAQHRDRCPKCGSPNYRVVSSPVLVQYCKCNLCGETFKVVK